MKNQNKKILLLVALLVTLLIGCGQKQALPPVSDEAVQPAPGTESTPERQSAEEEAIIPVAEELFSRHLDCMLHVMELGELPHADPTEGENIVPVTDEHFPTYDAFLDYISGIYSTEIFHQMVNAFPYEGEPKYLNRDGKLYLNLNLCGGKGYYVDWTDYTIEIDSLSRDTCDFTAIATVTWPAENPQPEEYRVKAQLIQTPEGWRMNTRDY